MCFPCASIKNVSLEGIKTIKNSFVSQGILSHMQVMVKEGKEKEIDLEGVSAVRKTYLVIDGMHRILAFREYCAENISSEINYSFRATVYPNSLPMKLVIALAFGHFFFLKNMSTYLFGSIK